MWDVAEGQSWKSDAEEGEMSEDGLNLEGRLYMPGGKAKERGARSLRRRGGFALGEVVRSRDDEVWIVRVGEGEEDEE